MIKTEQKIPKITFIIIALITAILITGVIAAKLTVHDYVSVDPELRKEIMRSAYASFDNPLERTAILLGNGRIISVQPPFSAEVQYFTLFHIPIGILRGKPDLKIGVFLNKGSDVKTPADDSEPDEMKIKKAEAAIRNFMGNPELELQYISKSDNPSNFTVGKTSGLDKGVFVMKPAEGWNRPVYVFQQKKFINDRCEVYGYEVSAGTFQVIEVHIDYPRWFQPEKGECSNLGSLDWPLKTKDDLEQAVFAVLKNDPEHTAFLLRSDIQPQFIPSKPGAEYPSASEWRWEDKNIELPEGLDGDPWQHPIARVIMSSGGKLMYYLNTTDLFEN